MEKLLDFKKGEINSFNYIEILNKSYAENLCYFYNDLVNFNKKEINKEDLIMVDVRNRDNFREYTLSVVYPYEKINFFSKKVQQEINTINGTFCNNGDFLFVFDGLFVIEKLMQKIIKKELENVEAKLILESESEYGKIDLIDAGSEENIILFFIKDQKTLFYSLSFIN